MSSKVVLANGIIEWRKNGLFHRTDGPAVILPDRSNIWYIDGVLHREDGPAFMWADGRQEWYIKGKLHRIDGPAVISNYGYIDWWINGIYITPNVNDWMRKQNVTWPWDAETQALFLLTFT